MYTVSDKGELSWSADKDKQHPYESAGCVIYTVTSQGSVQIPIFLKEKIDDKTKKTTGKMQAEFFPAGKADFGIIKKDDSNTIKQFVTRFKQLGEEAPTVNALRKLNEELDGVLDNIPQTDKNDVITIQLLIPVGLIQH